MADSHHLLGPLLADRLRCPACRGGDWEELPDEDGPATGAIRCPGCGRRWLVVEGIPVMTEPLEGDRTALLRSALGRFSDLLEGTDQVLEQVRSGTLTDAFEVTGMPWVGLRRFDWLEHGQLAELAPSGEGLLDLGCGFGASSAPLLQQGKASWAIGMDESLFFLLLFQRYASERLENEVALVCHDANRLPLPFRGAAADTILAASFFNHFACLKTRREIRAFFAETARLIRPGGTLLVDMLPSRAYPFPREINLAEVISSPRFRRYAHRVLRRLPTSWLPSRLTVPALWAAYRLYLAATRRPALPYRSFTREIGKALPEAALNGLPWTLGGYDRLVQGFTMVELFDERPLYAGGEQVPAQGRRPRLSYLVLRATR